MIHSLINHVNMRIDLDCSLHSAIKPLVNIKSAVQQVNVETCHGFIASDLEKVTFLSEYRLAAELLADVDCDTPRTFLQALEECSPEELDTIKVALARIIVTKPHSADVERLISLYNKFKSIRRSSLSRDALFNYMYVNVNMGSLEQFDPTAAVEYFMSLRNRKPKTSDTNKEGEWFHAVFDECESGRKRHGNLKIVF